MASTVLMLGLVPKTTQLEEEAPKLSNVCVLSQEQQK